MVNKEAISPSGNNDLLNTLVNRQIQQPAPQEPQATASTPPQPVPATPPSGGKTNTPPQVDRFINAQKLTEAYRNGWNPNPLLLRATMGSK